MKKVEGKKQIFNSSKSKKYENHRNYFFCGVPPPPPTSSCPIIQCTAVHLYSTVRHAEHTVSTCVQLLYLGFLCFLVIVKWFINTSSKIINYEVLELVQDCTEATFWCVRMWPYRPKVSTLSIIKPVIF